MSEPSAAAPLLSIVTPAYNEERNLPLLYERLVRSLGALGIEWEWIAIDDRSLDGTPRVLRELGATDRRVRGVRLARNCGSHAAIACGLMRARGAAAVILAADCQDPPERIGEMLALWRSGAEVVWAVRPDDGSLPAFSRLYWALLRRTTALRALPPTGADFFLAGRRAIDALNRIDERNVSLLARLTWLGFPQASLEVAKQPRTHGRSGWTLARKLKLVWDSVTAFTSFPIRALGLGGVLAAGLGGVALAGAATGESPGGRLLLAAVLLLGGAQLVGLAVLGEYLWRALEESRRTPRFLVEEELASSEEAPRS